MSNVRRKRCLAIAAVYPPMGGAGALKLAKLFKYLREHAWDVDVIAPRGRYGWYQDAGMLEEIDPSRVIRVGREHRDDGLLAQWRRQAKDPTSHGLPQALLRQLAWVAREARNVAMLPDEWLAWSTAAAAEARRRLSSQPVDLIFSSSFPYSSHLAAMWLAREFGTPWVAELRDPWFGPVFVRRQDDRVAGAVHRALERRVVAAADCISVVSPGMQSMYAERYPELGADLVQLPNGWDPSDFAMEVAPEDRERVEILYVGSFYKVLHTPEPFLRALRILQQRRPNLDRELQFRVLGNADLPTSETIRHWLERHRLGGVWKMHEPVPHRQAIDQMRRADAVVLSHGEGTPWVLTSKVFEYLAAGRPIIAAVPHGDCRTLLDDVGGAMMAHPDDSEALADCFEAVIERRPTHAPVDRARLDELSIPHIAERAAAIFDRVSARGSLAAESQSGPVGRFVRRLHEERRLTDPGDSPAKSSARLAYRLGRHATTLAMRPELNRVRRELERQGRAPIILLTYHGVSDEPENWLTFRTEAFRAHLALIREHASVIALDEALRRLRSGSNHELGVVLTFDDGYANNHQTLLPLMEAEALPGTLFVCPRASRDGTALAHDREHGFDAPLMSVEQLRDAGRYFEIGTHGNRHEDLSVTDDAQRQEAIVGSAALAAELLGRPVRYFAMPFGAPRHGPPAALELARQHYDAVFSSFGGYNLPGAADRFHFHRISAPVDNGSLLAILHGMHRMKPFAAGAEL